MSYPQSSGGLNLHYVVWDIRYLPFLELWGIVIEDFNKEDMMDNKIKLFVSVDKDLMKYKSVLTDTRPCSLLKSLLQPSIRGIFSDYISEFGVTYHIGGRPGGGNYYTIFYRIKLKNGFKVPLLLWNQCHITPYNNVDLCYGKWLTKSERFDIMTIETLREDTVSGCFRELVEVAHKLESGYITLAYSISLQEKKFIKDLLMLPVAIIILVAVIIICWLLFGIK
jgi:hypothetical protein